VKPFFDQLKEQYAELLQIKPQNQKVYLVGGAVRDLVLGHIKNDVDVLCEKDSKSVALQWAGKKAAAFYVLDDARKTYRVIITNEAKEKLIYDFAFQQGKTIEDDLSMRDFTINAMAIDFAAPEKLIDPLHGVQDIEQKLLRVCSAASFSSDPIRTLRAVRYSITYQLQIEANTSRLLSSSVHALQEVSGERKRDELFKILDLKNPVPALEILWKEGILSQLGIPEISMENIHQTDSLVRLFDHIEDTQAEKSEVLLSGFFEAINKYVPEYKKILTQKNTSDRNLHQLLILAYLVNGLSSDIVRRKAQTLMLSNEEIEYLITLMEHSGEIDEFVNRGDGISDRQLYLFFTQVHSGGLDLCLFAIARCLFNSAQSEMAEKLNQYFAIAGKIFTCWFDRQQIIQPLLLLNGNDLMINFDLTPGPAIGKLLDGLMEEQAAGKIQTREEAMVWMEEQINLLADQRHWNKDR